LHGSFTRDLDLIAVPWTPQALPPDLLVKQIEYRTDLKRQEEAFRAKPHGRMCWSLLLPGFTDPRWIDLSVMPALAPREEAPAAAGAAQAVAEEEATQPFFDLAWKHGARSHVSFAGDELEELSFRPSEFLAFCAALAATPAPEANGDEQ
jgi:hypothetical protein